MHIYIYGLNSRYHSAVLAGLTVSVEKPVTPRSRGVTYCMGCAAADDGELFLDCYCEGFTYLSNLLY